MTIIYSNFGDTDTEVLKNIWEGIDAKVFEFSANDTLSRYEVFKSIKEEKDTIIFCGHGNDYGLFDPKRGYIITPYVSEKINAKNIIGIWCHAREYSKNVNLRGFYTSMFISNPEEARLCGITNVSDTSITNSEIMFCKYVNELLKSNTPLYEWKKYLSKIIERKDSTSVDAFNYNGLFYNEGK